MHNDLRTIEAFACGADDKSAEHIINGVSLKEQELLVKVIFMDRAGDWAKLLLW